MTDTTNPRVLDKRVAQRYLKDGLLDAKAYQQHLKGLPDLADRAAPIEAIIEATQVAAAGSHPDEE